MEYEHELILVIVNNGFSELVMDVAKACGARGGTIINARGTAREEAEKLYNISISPEKEIVMILVPTSLKDDILHELYKKVGLDTPSQGIAFTLPVDNVVGIKEPKLERDKAK